MCLFGTRVPELIGKETEDGGGMMVKGGVCGIGMGATQFLQFGLLTF